MCFRRAPQDTARRSVREGLRGGEWAPRFSPADIKNTHVFRTHPECDKLAKQAIEEGLYSTWSLKCFHFSHGLSHSLFMRLGTVSREKQSHNSRRIRNRIGTPALSHPNPTRGRPQADFPTHLTDHTSRRRLIWQIEKIRGSNHVRFKPNHDFFVIFLFVNSAIAADDPYAEPAKPGLPPSAMELNLPRTALVVTDPQIDFLSEDGVTWGLDGESVTEQNTVENIERLFKTAKRPA